MNKRSIILTIFMMIVLPAVIWAAQKTVTTYTWDREIDVRPAQTLGCLNIADNSFACKAQGNHYVFLKVCVTDSQGLPVTTDVDVRYSIYRAHNNDNNELNVPILAIVNNCYGGTNTSYCGLGGNCARSINTFRQSPTVEVTATRGECTITKSMTVPYP